MREMVFSIFWQLGHCLKVMAGAKFRYWSQHRVSRLNSSDALRGFDMIWIMDADNIFHSLTRMLGSSFWNAVSTQFSHASWNGYYFYDFIFSIFLFLAGVAISYSIGWDLLY